MAKKANKGFMPFWMKGKEEGKLKAMGKYLPKKAVVVIRKKKMK